MRLLRTLSTVLLALILLAPAAAAQASPDPFPVGTDGDYQLGGPRETPPHVGVVVRDRRAAPVPGRYNVCYVNGFQTQPDEQRLWRSRMDLVLHRGGRPVADADWGEWLLDLRTSTKRERLAALVGRWTRGCARAGFDAVEYDNLDSFTRSGGLLKRRHAVAFARLLVRDAHRAGLAVGQKNLPGLRGTRIGFDFAVAEGCGRYAECGRYAATYGRRVLAVEYRARDFRRTCRTHGAVWPVVLRDRDVSPQGVRRFC